MATCGKPLVASHIVAHERLEPWAVNGLRLIASSFETSLRDPQDEVFVLGQPNQQPNGEGEWPLVARATELAQYQ